MLRDFLEWRRGLQTIEGLGAYRTHSRNLGATPRQMLAHILSRALTLMGSGIAAGGALLLLFLALGGGPSGVPMRDIALFTGHFAVTSVVMTAACLLACIGPARRALTISPTEALREA